MQIPNLDTDFSTAAAELESPPAGKMVLPANRFFVKRREKNRRRGVRQLIRPENAAAILPYLPVEPDDRTHCILRGDFVLCNLIPLLVAAGDGCDHLRIATLGMSVANADALATLVETGRVKALTVLVSLYFSQVDKATVFRDVLARLQGKCLLGVCRTHAKVILLTCPRASYVLEGSANLRSSDNLEQMLLLNDRSTLDFHAAWIDELAAQNGCHR